MPPRYLVIACLIAGCGGSPGAGDPCAVAAFAVQIDVQVSAVVGAERVVMHWADRPANEGVRGPQGSGVVSLRRELATRAEAAAFHVPFIVLVDGVERARAEIDFVACDLVADIGHDPASRTQAVYRFMLDNSTFEGGSNIAYSPRVACLTRATPPLLIDQLSSCPAAKPHLVYLLPLAAPLVATRVLLDGVPVEPRTIGRWDTGLLLEIDLESARDGASLSVELGGASAGTLQTASVTCPRAPSPDGTTPALAYQRQSLKIEAGVLQLDSNAGYECGWVDGQNVTAIP